MCWDKAPCCPVCGVCRWVRVLFSLSAWRVDGKAHDIDWKDAKIPVIGDLAYWFVGLFILGWLSVSSFWCFGYIVHLQQDESWFVFGQLVIDPRQMGGLGIEHIERHLLCWPYVLDGEGAGVCCCNYTLLPSTVCTPQSWWSLRRWVVERCGFSVCHRCQGQSNLEPSYFVHVGIFGRLGNFSYLYYLACCVY
jgi:hypothetical protein